MTTRLATSPRPHRTFFLSGIAAASLFFLCLTGSALATGTGANINGPVVASGSLAIFGSRVVWSERDSFSSVNQIYWRDFASSGTATRLSASSNNQISPAIYGNIIVWVQADPLIPGSSDIYYKDVTAGGAVRLTDNGAAYPKCQPTISGRLVAWSEPRDIPNNVYKVYTKIIAPANGIDNGTAVDLGDSSNQGSPTLSDRYLVWTSWSSLTSASHLRTKRINSSLDIPFDLCTASGSQYDPSVCDGLVAWEDTRGVTSQIYYYDLTAGQPVSPAVAGKRLEATTSMQTQPVVSANKIAWTDDINVATTGTDIYTKDMVPTFGQDPGKPPTTRLVPDTGNQSNPVMSGDKIAWFDATRTGSDTVGDVKVLKLDSAAVYATDFKVGSVTNTDSGWTVATIPADPSDPNQTDTNAYWAENTRYHAPDNGGTHSLWMAGHGGAYNSDTGNYEYVNNMNTTLTRTVDLTGYTMASMGFYFRSTMALDGGPDTGDKVVVQFRDAVGDPISSIGSDGRGGVWLDQNPTGWQFVNIDLTPAVGQVVTVVLHAITNPADTDQGAYIDNLYVTGSTIWPATVPKGTVTILPTDPDVPGFVKSSTVTLQLDAADFTGSQVGLQMAFSNNGVNWSPAEAYGTFKVWNLNNVTYGGTASEGPKTVYAKFIDALGVPSADPPASALIYLDSTAPTSPTVGINGPASITSPIVDLAVSAVDGDFYGLAQMQFSNDGSHWSVWETYSLLRSSWDLTEAAYGGTSGSGTKRVYARFRDLAGNVSASSPAASVTYTSIAPTGAIFINGVAAYTNTPVVSLDVSATATDPATVTDMRFSNNGSVWSDWQTYGTNKAGWDITNVTYGGISANGTKTVFVQFRDSMTRVSTSSISDTIIYDTVAPSQPTIVVAAPHQTSIWSNDNTITMSWSGSTDLWSGVGGAVYAWNTTAVYNPDLEGDLAPAVGSYTSTRPNGNSWYFHIRTRDGAGNWSETVNRGPYFIDATAPTGTVQINGGDLETTNSVVTLTLNASDIGGSNLNLMRFSNNGSVWSPWEGYGTSRADWDLKNYGGPGGAITSGLKTVYAQFKDSAENISAATISDTIVYTAAVTDTTSPTGTITIKGGVDATLSNSVILTLTSTDQGTPSTGVAEMRFSNTGSSSDWSPWETIDTTKNGWNLTTGYGATAGHGLKTVYAQFRDAAGNQSALYTDTINLWPEQDFNRDGNSDVAMLYDYGNAASRLWLFNSNGATVSPAASPWYGPGFNAAQVKMVSGDFNGDGRSDAAMLYDYGNATSRLWLFTSNGLTMDVTAVWYGPGFDANRVKLTSGDYNGDGLTDVAMLYDYGSATSRLWTFISNGTTLSPTAAPWVGAGFDAARVKLASGDFNGDGKADIAMLYDYGNATSRIWQFTSTGIGWNPTPAWFGGTRAFDANRVKLTSGDYDGDGLCDLAMLYDNGNATSRLWKFTANGTSMVPTVAWYGPGFEANRAKLTSGDIDGDHKSDVQMLYDYGNATSRLWNLTSDGTNMTPTLAWYGPGFDATRVKLAN